MPKDTGFGKWRFAAYTVVGVFGVASVVLAYQQVDQFLIRDPRFALASVEDDETSSISLAGVRNASRERIFDVFRPEQGRSVYRLPLAERRRRLLGVEWVKDASVSRIWPNLLAVEVIERKPVAFVRLVEDTSSSRLHLIDEDGVLLPLTRNAKFKLPVVTGISRLQKEEERKTRIRRMLKLQSEVGAHMDRISEIDLSDADNLKITYPMRNRGLVLYVGYNHFAFRLKRFLDNYEEVQKRIPEARALDLRLEDRITAVKDETAGEHRVE